MRLVVGAERCLPPPPRPLLFLAFLLFYLYSTFPLRTLFSFLGGVQSFMRRMGTDRVILCLLCIIVLGIVFAIIYSLIDPDGASESTNVPDDLVPQF